MINTNKIMDTIIEETANIDMSEVTWHEILACTHQLISKLEIANTLSKYNVIGDYNDKKKKNNINEN